MDVNQIVNRLKQQAAQTAPQEATLNDDLSQYSKPTGTSSGIGGSPEAGFDMGADGMLATPDGRSVKMSESFLSERRG